MSHHTYSTHTQKTGISYIDDSDGICIPTLFVNANNLIVSWKRHFLDHASSSEIFIYSVFFPIRKRNFFYSFKKKSVGVLANILTWISHGESKDITKPHIFLPHQFLSGQSLNYFKSSILCIVFSLHRDAAQQ